MSKKKRQAPVIMASASYVTYVTLFIKINMNSLITSSVSWFNVKWLIFKWQNEWVKIKITQDSGDTNIEETTCVQFKYSLLFD